MVASVSGKMRPLGERACTIRSTPLVSDSSVVVVHADGLFLACSISIFTVYDRKSTSSKRGFDQKMNKTIRFYWDVGSTNTYFAFHLIRPLAARYDAVIEYIPFNLGYVFRHHNYALTDEPKAKMKNRKIDLMRWAKRYDLPFQVPSEFPIKTSRVLRGALVMREYDLELPYLEGVFQRYWEEQDASIQSYEGLALTVESLGVSAETFRARCESPELQRRFIETTQTALAEGVFGAPTMVVDGQIYWGKDRMEFVEDHLRAD